MMRGVGLVSLLALGSLACGGEVGEEAPMMRVGFRMHELECTIEGQLLAKLQVAGIPGFCDLDVAPDRTVSGVCSGVPTGDVRMFRLVYYMMIGGVEVQLATVIETVDLTGETRGTITVEFPSDAVESLYDDDGDRTPNLVEVCQGTDPLINGS